DLQVGGDGRLQVRAHLPVHGDNVALAAHAADVVQGRDIVRHEALRGLRRRAGERAATSATSRSAATSARAGHGRWTSFAPRTSSPDRLRPAGHGTKKPPRPARGAMVLAVPPTFPRRVLPHDRGSASDGSPSTGRGVAIAWAW